MSLIKCPSCQKQISNKVEACPHCNFSFNVNSDELARMKILNYRNFRGLMFRFKMLSFTAIAIAVIGLVPMLWNYAQAIDYGFNASLINHWGIYLVVAGFFMYVIVRAMMLLHKRKYKKSR